MKSHIAVLICFVLAVGVTQLKAEEYNEGREFDENEKYDEIPNQSDASVDDETRQGDMELERRALKAGINKEIIDPVIAKKEGFCQWGINVWYKPGYQVRCKCMKCSCRGLGKWDCGFHFDYCPFYYCGNQIYNPYSQICCCGKLHPKKDSWRCCGYYYYNVKISKCCDYYSIKPKSANCPRSKV